MGTDDPDSYGKAFADVYDAWYGDVSDVDSTVAAIADLAAGGSVLELGVGTGRLALPLADRGVDVHGVDSSAAMLELLAAKPGAGRVTIHLGDMADPVPGGPFAVVFVAFNTLFNLTDPRRQRDCVRAAADALEHGGCFVVEAFVPAERSADDPIHGDTARDDGAGGVVRTLTTHVPDEQIVHGVHVHRRADGTTVDRPWKIRYLSPDQIDEIALAAGLAVSERWSDFDRSPFDPGSARHVSVYRRR